MQRRLQERSYSSCLASCNKRNQQQAITVETLTPIEALNQLYQLKQLL